MSDPKADSQKHSLMIQIGDYLLDKGHAISKPLVVDIVEFVYDLQQAAYAQGQHAGQAQTHDTQPKRTEVNKRSHFYTEDKE